MLQLLDDPEHAVDDVVEWPVALIVRGSTTKAKTLP